MGERSALVQHAFERHLEVQGLRVANLTLGSAFKAMLEFHHGKVFDWADREWDALRLEWDEARAAPVTSGGFFGLFQTRNEGEITAYDVLVSRSIDAAEVDGDTETTDDSFVILSVRLRYLRTPRVEAAFAAAPDDTGLDSDSFDDLESFVAAALELDLFKTLAFEAPSAVELMIEAAY